MCRSLPAAHLLLISCRPLFPMASTWTSKLSQMDPGKMKRCPRPYRGGDPLQWKRYEEEWNEETASERKKRAEISSSTLAGRVSECVRADSTSAKHFGEMVFDYICQVVQQATLAMDHATGKFFGTCARNESNPCEIDTV